MVNIVKLHQLYFRNISYSQNNVKQRNFSIALVIHSILYNALQFGSENLTTKVIIDNESYYIVILKPGESIASPYVLEKEFPRLASNICHIHCNIIEPYHFDDKHCQIIRTISLPRYNNYFFNPVKSPQYYKINKDCVQQISIKLLTEDFQSLPLLPGVASIVKLKFKAMDKPKVSYLKVSSNSEKYSTFDNKNNNFRIKIPPNLSFDQPKLHVGVSSISFPNKFKTLPPDSHKYIYIYTLQEDLKMIDTKKIFIPEGSFDSNSDFLDSLNQQMVKKGVSNISFVNSFQSKDSHYNTNQHCIIQSLQLNTIIILPLHLSILLGIKKDFIRLNEKGDYHWGDVGMHNQFHISNRIRRKAQSKSLDIVKIVQEALSEKEQVLRNSHFICLNAGENYYFDHAMNILEFRPKYFLFYNNICEHYIYDTKFLKILKIVPVKQSKA